MPMPKAPRWTQAEIAVLEEFYPEVGVDCVEYLPGRTWKSIHQKAFKLGLRCEKLTDAPKALLQGDVLEEAIRLREEEGWAFARIAAKFGICEASASNSVLIALCPRKGYRPAERLANGRLTAEGLARLRYALKRGLKAVDIQLRLGLSASRIALERRRYNAELKANGKALLPPPGNGEEYSGVKVPASKRREVEQLLLEGLGAPKIVDRLGTSKTTVQRIRARLVKRLARKGEALPGCDMSGHRHTILESARYVPDESRALVRKLVLERLPVFHAADCAAVGKCTAYRIRDELREELRARGEVLPPPDRSLWRRGRGQEDPYWPPIGTEAIYAFRQLLGTRSFDEAKAEWRRRECAKAADSNGWSTDFQRRLDRVASGQIGIERSSFVPQLPHNPQEARA